MNEVPFADVVGQFRETRDAILSAWADILDTGAFVSGPEVQRFEEEFAAMCGTEHCVAVSSGTDALTLAMQGLGAGRGTRVAVPANTFIATAEGVSNAGAEPVFVDCARDTALIDTAALAAVENLDGVVPVHLYGLPADVGAIRKMAPTGARWVLEDAAQAHLAGIANSTAGSLGAAGCFSFYPGKNLGAPGEGGAVTTDDAGLAGEIRMLRDHGQREKYRSARVGWNARMTEMAAVALRLRLPLLPAWTEARRQVASWYLQRLGHLPQVGLQRTPEGRTHAYHLFVVTVPQRDAVADALRGAGIAVGLHYPIPLHLQPAYRHMGHAEGAFPNAEWRAARLLSLPMSPSLTEAQVERVCDVLAEALPGESEQP